MCRETQLQCGSRVNTLRYYGGQFWIDHYRPHTFPIQWLFVRDSVDKHLVYAGRKVFEVGILFCRIAQFEAYFPVY